MSNYQLTVDLPTNGYFYEDGPTQVTLRDIMIEEENLLLGSVSDNTLLNIVKSCIVNPKGLDINTLLPADLHYLLMQLRIHTYGSDYKVSFSCPRCNERENEVINLDNLPVFRLTEPYPMPIVFTLPMCKDELGVRLLLQSDIKSIDILARKLTKNSTKNRAQISNNLRIAKSIVTINNKEVDESEAQKYVKSLHGRDSAYYWSMLNKRRIGYDVILEHTCSNCGANFEMTMPTSSEFFRPTFD